MRYPLLNIYLDETNEEEIKYYDSGKYQDNYYENKKKFDQEFGQIYLAFLTLENDLDEFLEYFNKNHSRIKVLGLKINDFKNRTKDIIKITSEENFSFLFNQLKIFKEYRNELSHSTIYYHLMEGFFFLYPNEKRIDLYPNECISLIEDKKALKLNEDYLNHISFFSANLGIEKKRIRRVNLFTKEKSKNQLYGIADLIGL